LALYLNHSNVLNIDLTFSYKIILFCQNWGGKENGFGLAECCQELPMSSFPSSATTLHFEYYCDDSANKKANALSVIHVDNIDQIDKSLAQIMEEMIETYKVPTDKQMLLFTHLRLAKSFSNYKKRLQCVQARLQALSIIGMLSDYIFDLTSIQSYLMYNFVFSLLSSDVITRKRHFFVI
jgi:hypothetical protein